MSDHDGTTEPGSSQRTPGPLCLVLTGLAAGGFFGAGVTAVETVIALFSGSYIAAEIIVVVFAFWTVVAAVGGAVLALAAMPVALMLKGGARRAAVAAPVLAAGFCAHAINLSANLAPHDPLGASVMLHPVFLCIWGVLIAGIFVRLCLSEKETSALNWYLSAVSAVLFSAGVANFAWRAASTFILAAGPLFLLAITGLLAAKSRGARPRRWLPAAAVPLYAAALVAAAAAAGDLADGPIDHDYRPLPGAVAMLAGKPNVVLVTLDTARADRMSVCGHEFPTTPYLEKLVADCRFFPCGATVNSWTLPAHASLLTGKYPREHGAHSDAAREVMGTDGVPLTGIPLSRSQLTLATYLSKTGYNTAAFVANYVWLARQFGLSQGFAYYFDLPRYCIFAKSAARFYKCGIRAAKRLSAGFRRLSMGYWGARTVTRFAQRWVRKNGDTPFFLFLNYMDPHETYAPPLGFDHVDGSDIPYSEMVARLSSWRDFHDDYINNGGEIEPGVLRQIRNQYDGELAYADYWLGRFIETLKSEGLYDNTLIIVTSDHGEFFGEHQLLNHGVGVYEGGLRIPILVKYPGGDHAGEVMGERVSIRDIFATVLDVLALPIPPGVTAEPLGAAANPVLGEDYANGMNVRRYGERFRRSQTVIYSGDWKYIESSAGSRELFNLREDPRETDNKVGSNPEIAASLAAKISEWKEKTPEFDGSRDVEGGLSPEMIELLKSLGYMTGG